MSIFIRLKPMAAVFNTAEQPSYIEAMCGPWTNHPGSWKSSGCQRHCYFSMLWVCNCYSFSLAALSCDHILYDIFLGKEENAYSFTLLSVTHRTLQLGYCTAIFNSAVTGHTHPRQAINWTKVTGHRLTVAFAKRSTQLGHTIFSL